VNAADQRLFDRFMIKPVLPNELVRAVTGVLRDRTPFPRRADQASS